MTFMKDLCTLNAHRLLEYPIIYHQNSRHVFYFFLARDTNLTSDKTRFDDLLFCFRF
jgi:hypothetical protein